MNLSSNKLFWVIRKYPDYSTWENNNFAQSPGLRGDRFSGRATPPNLLEVAQ